ncbi:acyl carrier protein [Paenibacillus sp. S-38]|uniref:acyl carrier protein n=1 Tax=Paenibacillus sp. S-38 TaxID=3416710 RepID=UPI003CF9EA47
MEQRIIELIGELKKDPALAERLTPESSILKDSGMESLLITHFILRVEDEFGVEIDFDTFDLSHLDSIASFCGYIRQHLPETAESGR